MTITSTRHYQYLVWFTLILLIPALFINLGMSPLIGDEAIRGVVAFEMQQSGNLMIPTINGEHYYNKPPLYNWILLGFFNIFKQHSEFILRLPSVISLLFFGLLIYFTTRRELGKRVAFLSSLIFISCGRILFYDSMRGLIDLSFSMIVFLNFYLIYYFLTRRKYYALFLLSYLLTSIAFLMKGLPAMIFQVLTLFTALAYFKSLKKLFHLSHLSGILVFVLLAGGYYYLLWENTRDPEFFMRLVSESTKRTIMVSGLWTAIKHVFIFPFEQVYHLLPWSLLFILLFRKSFYNKLRENRYPGYLALVFLVNIPVYWTSFGTNPRYLFMLYPILFILLVLNYFDLKQDESFFRVFWRIFFILSGLALVTLTWYFLSHSISESIKTLITYSLTMVIVLSGYFIIWKKKDIRLEMLIIILLLWRVFFNVVVLPDRLANAPGLEELKAVEKICEITEGSELKMHQEAPVSINFVYYISTAREEVLRKEYDQFKKDSYYIFDSGNPLRKGEKKILEFESSWDHDMLRLSIFTEDQESSTVDNQP